MQTCVGQRTAYKMRAIKRAPDAGKYRALLTDLDGTLIHSQDAICDALFIAFRHVGAAVPEKKDILGMFGLPVEEMLIELGHVSRSDTGCINEFIAEYKRQYPVHMATGARLIKNAAETMKAVAAAGYPICLITSERRVNAQYIMNTLGLSESVRYLISRDDVTRFKPDPEPICSAAAAVGQAAEDCVYIGESPYDIEAGVRAGAYVVAIGSGNWSVDSLLVCEPDALAEDISELNQLFGLQTV